MSLTKITAKIHKPMWDAFKKQTEGLFLKRDAFFDYIINTETRYLAQELAGKQQSFKANRYIAGMLKKADAHQVSISVKRETSVALQKVVDETNMVRDAFINRLIMLLRGSKWLLNHLDVPKELDMRHFSGAELMPSSPMQAMEAVRDDPLFYLRTRLESDGGSGLYLFPLPTKLHGFSCYLDDEDVPNTIANKKKTAEVESWL